jgi:putative endonuclease
VKRKIREAWHLYIAECSDGSYYTGIAKDVDKRIAAHNSGKGAKYTSTRGPIRAIFREPQADYSAALRREYQVKTLSKERKVRFVAGESLPGPKKKSRMSFQRKRKPKANAKTQRKAGSLEKPKNQG